MTKNNNLRVAWLLPSAVLYWQPLLSEFTKVFPQTTVFTALWRGFIQGFENAFTIEVVGQRKFFQIGSTTAHYSSGILYLSPEIVKRLLHYKPDIVFTNSFGLWTTLAICFKKIGGWRVIIAYEGSSPGVDYRKSTLRIWFRKQLAKQANALITNSEAGRKYLVECLKCQEERVFKRPYEVPDSKVLRNFQAIELNLKQLQSPIFVYVGQVIPRKNLFSLLQACAKLETQGYQNYSLLVIGDGIQREELEAFCKTHALQNRIRWLGKVPYEQLGAHLHATDVFVLPTLEDTWGLVVLEAMLLGKSVICSSGAGAAELVIEDENGYCFNPQDVEQLVEAMKKFIYNPNLAKSMGEVSQQLIAQYSPITAARFLSDVAFFALKS